MDTVFNHFSSGNFQLLVDYGLMKPLDKGTHYYLPILQRSIDRTCAVIERFMNKIEAQKITIPNLTPVEMWQDSGMNLTQLLEQKSSECLSLSLDEDFFMLELRQHEVKVLDSVWRLINIRGFKFLIIISSKWKKR